MSTGTLRINGQKFRVIPEEEYRPLQALMKAREREAQEDARDTAIAVRRLKDRRRKSIPLSAFNLISACKHALHA